MATSTTPEGNLYATPGTVVDPALTEQIARNRDELDLTVRGQAAEALTTVKSYEGQIKEAATAASDAVIRAKNLEGFVESFVEAAGLNAVACFGDSMFADSGSLGVTVPGYLAQELGVEVFAGGVGGQTSTEIAVRQGGLDVFLTVQNDTIPASGSVPVTVNYPDGAWRPTGGFSCLGKLAGVDGTLTRTAAGAWSFARTTGGDSVRVVPETRWESAYSAYRDRVSLFRSGRNNLSSDPALILRDDKAMVSGLAGTNNRYLVLSVYNDANEKAGGLGHGRMMAINAARAEAFGQNYYDLRGWIIRHGLAQAGITPTAQDLQNIADDIIPASLRVDDTHMNAAGRKVEAEQLARVLRAKGWVAPPPPLILTVTNRVDNPRVGTDATSWSISQSGGVGTGVRVATGGPLPEAPTFYRANWTALPTSQQILVDADGMNLIEAGKKYTVKAFARASWEGAKAQIIAARRSTSGIVGTSPNGAVQDLAPGVWTALPPVTFTAESTAIRARLAVQVATASTKPGSTDTLDVSAWFLHDADDRLLGVTYRDGSSGGWQWTGTAHASPSTGPVEV